MASPATINTVLDHTTDAAFRVWVAELITFLVTTLGLTQTADTGQINTTTVTRPGTATAAGYVILRFNDTAQATSPIFIKLEFGTGGSTTSPALFITIGTGSNGSGTLTGVVGTRVAASNFTAPSSTITPYITAGCYNTTVGFLGLQWKINGNAIATAGLGGFFIFRSADNSGAVTTDAVNMLTNTSSASGTSNGATYQAISYLTSVAYNTASPFNNNGAWCVMPFLVTSTLQGSNTQTGLCFQYTPVLGITPWLAVALQSEWAMNSTNTETIVGASAHTYRMIGGPAGCSTFASGSSPSGLGSSVYGIVMLWE